VFLPQCHLIPLLRDQPHYQLGDHLRIQVRVHPAYLLVNLVPYRRVYLARNRHLFQLVSRLRNRLDSQVIARPVFLLLNPVSSQLEDHLVHHPFRRHRCRIQVRLVDQQSFQPPNLLSIRHKPLLVFRQFCHQVVPLGNQPHILLVFRLLILHFTLLAHHHWDRLVSHPGSPLVTLLQIQPGDLHFYQPLILLFHLNYLEI